MASLFAQVRRYPWMVCLLAALVAVGCGQKQVSRKAAKAHEDEQPSADGQAPSEPDGAKQAGAEGDMPEQPLSEGALDEPIGADDNDDLLTSGSVSIPDLATDEQRRGKGIPDGALILDLGGNVRTYATELPFAVVVEQGEPVILLGEEGSKLWISAKFCDKDGKLMCDIEKNELRVDDNSAFWIEREPSTLTLYENQIKEGDAKDDDAKDSDAKDDGSDDKRAKKLLTINFLNPGAVRLFGDFHSPKGLHVVIDESGVHFGDGRSLSATGLNGTSVNLDPPASGGTESTPVPTSSTTDDDPALVKSGEDADTASSVADVGAAMTAAAEAFLAALDSDELAKAKMKFDDPARLDWSNIPKKQRKGLPMLEMTDPQRALCHKLLRSGLSASGYEKAVKIMGLENNLREGEKNLNTGWDRNPRRYYLTVFGEPAGSGTWGWSLEGHHLSVNYVIRDGEVVSDTPSFWGANPATVRIFVPGGPKEGTRTLAGEEQLAFDLLSKLSDEQRAKAVIADTAPPEYRGVGTPQPPSGPPEGLPAGEMSEQEKTTLHSLLETYASHLAPPLAAAQLADIESSGFDRVYFAWAGASQPGVGHYYRIQGPTFVLELVNFQSDPAGNAANHIHSVWRSLRHDFGVAAN